MRDITTKFLEFLCFIVDFCDRFIESRRDDLYLIIVTSDDMQITRQIIEVEIPRKIGDSLKIFERRMNQVLRKKKAEDGKYYQHDDADLEENLLAFVEGKCVIKKVYASDTRKLLPADEIAFPVFLEHLEHVRLRDVLIALRKKDSPRSVDDISTDIEHILFEFLEFFRRRL